jgi:alanyl-tRNA synthetase
MLEKQLKQNGITYWAYRPCTMYAQGMNHRIQQIEEDLKEVKKCTTTNKEAIEQLERNVEEVAVISKKNEGMTMEEIEARLKEERDENRERKDREMNVIIHGISENKESELSGAEKMERDVRKCVSLFNDAGLLIQPNEVKF